VKLRKEVICRYYRAHGLVEKCEVEGNEGIFSIKVHLQESVRILDIKGKEGIYFQ